MYVLNYSGFYGPGMCRVWEKREMRTVFGGRHLKKRSNLGDLGIDVCKTLKFIFKK